MAGSVSNQQAVLMRGEVTTIFVRRNFRCLGGFFSGRVVEAFRLKWSGSLRNRLNKSPALQQTYYQFPPKEQFQNKVTINLTPECHPDAGRIWLSD